MSPYVGPPIKPAAPVRASIIRVMRFYAWLFCIFIVTASILFIVDVFMPEESTGLGAFAVPFVGLILVVGLLGINALRRSSKNYKSSKVLKFIKWLVNGIFITIGIFLVYVAYNYLIAYKNGWL